MAPIRVCLVGLSTGENQATPVSNWGIMAHLKPILASPHYQLVAVCNSSIESAQRSIKAHQLPDTVKAYGDIEAVANDPDIDLVSISVNVAKHHALTKPLLLKKKNVIVEWPFGATVEESEELSRLAAVNGVKGAVGAQFQSDPILIKLKALLDSNAIGTITNSVVTGCSSAMPLDGWFDEAAYYLDMKSGGNEFYIFFGHFLVAFTHVLGDFSTIQSTLKSQYPVVPLVDYKTMTVTNPSHPKSSPDHILVQGELDSGAVASINFHWGKSSIDKLVLRWIISGTEGEIEMTIPDSSVQMGVEGRAIRMRIGKHGDVQNVQWETPSEPEHIKAVPFPGTNSARMYEEYAIGKEYADFSTAAKSKQLLHKIARAGNYI